MSNILCVLKSHRKVQATIFNLCVWMNLKDTGKWCLLKLQVCIKEIAWKTSSILHEQVHMGLAFTQGR